MKKSDIAKKVKKDLKVSDKEYRDVVNSIFEDISEKLINGQEVKIRNFGTLKIKVHKAKNGRNPKTGEKIRIPSKRTIKLVVSKKLKDDVATKYSDKTTKVIEE